jgi:hypothetical protein
MTDRVQNTYRIFGLSVESELPLPELVPAEAMAVADVVIRLSAPETEPPTEFHLSASNGEITLSVPGIATYRMRNGACIAVAPEIDASERDVRLFLLGSAFAAILHQRGLLPLHSNAIEIDGKAIAFLGHSGAGKSTLAAWFHDRGHGVLSDDVCVVGVDAEGRGIAYGGVPRVRLWRDALEASGRTADGEERAADEWEKYNVRTDHAAIRHEAALSHIYLFAGDGTEVDTVVTRLVGSRAVQALVENTYRGAYVKLLGKTQRHFDQCVRLAQNLAIFEVRRPWGLNALDRVGIALETHAKAFIEARASLDADQPFLRQ